MGASKGRWIVGLLGAIVVVVLVALTVNLASRSSDRKATIDALDDELAAVQAKNQELADDLAQAQELTARAESRWLASVALSTDYSPRISRLLAVEALRRAPTVAARAAVGNLILADTRSEAPIVELEHDGGVWAVAFSGDGQFAATASGDGTVGVWSVPSGQRLASLEHDASAHSVEFAAEGDVIVTGSIDGTARVWSLAGVELTQVEHAERVNDVAISADGSIIASVGHDGMVIVADARSGDRLFESDLGEIAWNVALSPGGDRLAAGSNDGVTRLWSLPDGELIAELTHGGPVEVVSISPNGLWLYAGGQGGVMHVADTATGTIQFTPDASVGRGSVTDVGWHPGGSEVAVTALGAGISRLALPDGALIASHRQSGGQRGIAYAPDGSWFVGNSGDFQFSFGEISIWDTAEGRKLVQVNLGGPVESIAVSPEGLSVLAGFRTTVNQVETGAAIMLPGESAWLDLACEGSDGGVPDSVIDDLALEESLGAICQ